jgi:hypothetical protein
MSLSADQESSSVDNNPPSATAPISSGPVGPADPVGPVGPVVYDVVEEHWAFNLLNARKLLNAAGKCDILNMFRSLKPSHLFESEHCRTDGLAATVLETIHTTSKSYMQKNWGQRRTAEELTKLIIILEANDKTAADKKAEGRQRRGARELPAALKALKALIRKCALHAKQEADAITTTGKWKSKCPASAPDGRPWQSQKVCDALEALKEQPCPHCKMNTVNAVVSFEETENMNNLVKERHSGSLEVWESSGRTGPKPKAGKTVSQTMACFGSAVNCRMREDGKGCVDCVGFKQNGIVVGTTTTADGRTQLCACLLCQNPCAEVFFRHELTTIARGIANKEDGFPEQSEFGFDFSRSRS